MGTMTALQQSPAAEQAPTEPVFTRSFYHVSDGDSASLSYLEKNDGELYAITLYLDGASC
jgi:hypothetical protein